MRAALVRREGVDFVDDHRAGGRQHLAPGLRAEQHVERFRRRHQDVRRAAAHALALGAGRVAGPDPGADFDIGQPAPAELLADSRERPFQIAMDVVRQRLQRRHVDDMGLVRERRLEALSHEIVDRGQEGRERLARAGRRGDERVAAGLDRRPRFGLRGSRRREALGEPVRDRRMEQGSYCRRQSRGGLAPPRAVRAVVVEARSVSKRLGSPGTRRNGVRAPIGRRVVLWSPPPRPLAERGDLGSSLLRRRIKRSAVYQQFLRQTGKAEMTSVTQPTVTLNDGASMPSLGSGSFRRPPMRRSRWSSSRSIRAIAWSIPRRCIEMRTASARPCSAGRMSS